MKSNTLVASHLQKTFNKRSVVKDVSFTIKSGEVVGLLGPNGAGKTTCFYMIVGLEKNDGGHILLNDQRIEDNPVHIRARKGLGYLPQEPSIFQKLSVADNIMAILETRKDLNTNTRKKRLNDLLHDLHISHLKEQIAISLSGGERRRLEIARTLAIDPDFILLDEPFAGVDPISVIDIQQIIKHLCERNIGVLITDHNVRETLGICDRAYILNDGRILAEGTPTEIMANQQVRKVYLGENFSI